MPTQLDTITQTLRELILAGDFEPGQKLGEVALAKALSVSRTPIRLAMGALEQEGLLAREPNRGFRVRGFTVEEVADAIEVRGELEAMAARLVVERGLAQEHEESFRKCLAEAELLLEPGVDNMENRLAWVEMNAELHATLVNASGNSQLVRMIKEITKLPLAGPRAMVFRRESSGSNLRQMRSSHMDHLAIFDAISRRQGMRAAALVREHAYKSSRNKRDNFTAMGTKHLAVKLPGVDLIV